jgi:hypothetical protein
VEWKLGRRTTPPPSLCCRFAFVCHRSFNVCPVSWVAHAFLLTSSSNLPSKENQLLNLSTMTRSWVAWRNTIEQARCRTCKSGIFHCHIIRHQDNNSFHQVVGPAEYRTYHCINDTLLYKTDGAAYVLDAVFLPRHILSTCSNNHGCCRKSVLFLF